MTATTEKFDKSPYGWTDEDGEDAYVIVTSSTATVEQARDWLLHGKGAGDVLGCDASRRVKADADLPLKALTISVPVGVLQHSSQYTLHGMLPHAVPVRTLVASGEATAWWEFSGAYSATEDVPDYDWRREHAAREARRDAEERRRAREDRGPLWWRACCTIADRLTSIARRIDRDDRSTAAWYDGDEKIVMVRVRGHRRLLP